MEEKQPIIALGAGGSSKLVFDHGKRIERVENVKDVTSYIARIDEMNRKKAYRNRNLVIEGEGKFLEELSKTQSEERTDFWNLTCLQS